MKCTKCNKDFLEKYLRGKSVNAHASMKLLIEFLSSEYSIVIKDFKFPKVRKYEKKLVRNLSNKQINLIISEMPFEYKFITKFMYLCGLRISELWRLKVSSVNWDFVSDNKSKYALLKITHTKSYRERQVPISPGLTSELYNFLKHKPCLSYRQKKAFPPSLAVLPNSYIFDFDTDFKIKRYIRKSKKLGVGFGFSLSDVEIGNHRLDWSWTRYIRSSSTRFQKLFRDASFRALGEKYHPHVLRASRATSLLASGLKLLEVRDFLGHRSISTTERYLRSGIKELYGGMEKLKI